MAQFEVAVQIDDEYDGMVSARWLEKVADRTLAAESAEAGTKVGVVIAGDEVVRELNKQHRGLDETTDVLAFSFTHHGEYYGTREPTAPDEDFLFALPPGETISLGEVVVSFPQAKRQAAQAGKPVENELAVLVTHGVLHLLGHDHQESEEETAMNRIEAEVLSDVLGSQRA